ncbi:MAG: hypothetical protein WC641_06005 [Patescibacteria group bacterium]
MDQPEVKQLAFEIPTDTGIMNALIGAVPENWTWLDGRLNAPQKLLESGLVAADVSILINGNPAAHILSEGRDEDLTNFLSTPCFPGKMWFKRVGLRRSFATAKQVAVRYVVRGYTGRLKFVLNGEVPAVSRDFAVCTLRLESGLIRQLPVPPYVHLKWMVDTDIDPILKVCRNFHLVELPLGSLAED